MACLCPCVTSTSHALIALSIEWIVNHIKHCCVIFDYLQIIHTHSPTAAAVAAASLTHSYDGRHFGLCSNFFFLYNFVSSSFLFCCRYGKIKAYENERIV